MENYYIVEEYENSIDNFISHNPKKSSIYEPASIRDENSPKSRGVIFTETEIGEDSECDACVCDLCGKYFASKSRLVSHIRYAHMSTTNVEIDEITRLPNSKFRCSLCAKEFRRKSYAAQHFVSHVAEKNFRCDRCSYRCYTKQQLDVHKRKHVKRFCCEVCSKMFAFKFQVETHVQSVHYNLRPFLCTVCHKRFKTRYNFGSHVAQQHEDVRNFQCPHCPRKCRKNYDLRIHIRTHTGEKPFQCVYCRRSYSQNGDKLKHERHCPTKPTPSLPLAHSLAEHYPDNEIPEIAIRNVEPLPNTENNLSRSAEYVSF